MMFKKYLEKRVSTGESMTQLIIAAFLELVIGTILSFTLGPVLDGLSVTLSTPQTTNLFTLIGQLHVWSWFLEAFTILGFVVAVFAATKSN